MKNVTIKKVTVKELNKMNSDELLSYCESLDHVAICDLSDDVFAILFKEATISATVTNASNRKASIHKYNESIMSQENEHIKAGMMKKQRQTVRKQLSKYVDGLNNNSNPISKIKFLKESKFNEFYSTYFILNDYSIESICATHKDDDKKKGLSSLITFAKQYKTKL